MFKVPTCEEEENSVKEMFTAILRRLDDQDQTIKTLREEIN